MFKIYKVQDLKIVNFHGCFYHINIISDIAVILLPAHPASFAHKFLFQRVPASPGMQ